MRILLLAVLAVSAAPGKADPRIRAAKTLEQRIGDLEREQAALPSPTDADAAEAAALSDSAPGSIPAREAREKIRRILKKRHEAEVPLVLEMTVAARRLQAYRQTGRLPKPEEVADVADLKRFLDDPWGQKRGGRAVPDCEILEHCRQAPALELGLPALMRQIERFSTALAPLVAERKIPSSPGVARAEPSARFRPQSGREASRPARAKRQTVPELVAMLALSDARQRALAADVLGSFGPEAAPAIDALRRSLSDRDSRVRASAAMALGNIAIATPTVLEDLQRSLSDPSEDVRLSSRAALGLLVRR